MKTHNKYLRAIRQSYSTLFVAAALCSIDMSAQSQMIVNPPVISSQAEIYPNDNPEAGAPYGYRASLGKKLHGTFFKEIPVQMNREIHIEASGNSQTFYFYVFNTNAPELYCATFKCEANTDFDEYVTVPSQGTYMVIAIKMPGLPRSFFYNNEDYITANITVNEVNSPLVKVGSLFMYHPQDTSCIYNSFTCNAKGGADPMILVIEGQGDNSKVVAYNDNSNSSSVFNWGVNAFVSKQYINPTTGIVVVDRNGNVVPDELEETNGSSDIYIGCKNVDMETSYGFGLGFEDAIESAPATDDYDAFMWALGRWNGEKMLVSSKFATLGYSSAKAFLDSVLYQAYGVVPSGLVNVPVIGSTYFEVWGDYVNGKLTPNHIAVKKTIDGVPHGYDYESKLGPNKRIFHTADMIGEGVYGTVKWHYVLPISIPPYRKDSLELCVVDNIDEVLDAIELAGTALPSTVKINFAKYYDKAKAAHIQSVYNDYEHLNTNRDYLNLRRVCALNPKAIYLAYKKLTEGDYFAIKLIEDMQSAQNTSLMNSIATYNQAHAYSNTGKRIIYSAFANATRFVNMIVSQSIGDNSYLETVSDRYSDDESAFRISQNNGSLNVGFDIERDSYVSITVSSLDGSFHRQVLPRTELEQGSHCYSVDLPSGNYTVSYNLNGNAFYKKINLK